MSNNGFNKDEINELLKTIVDLRSERTEANKELKLLKQRFADLRDQRIALKLDLDAARAAKGDPLIEIGVRGRLRGVGNDSDEITVFSISKDEKRQFKVDAASGKAIDATADDIASELRSLLKDRGLEADEIKHETPERVTTSSNPWFKTGASPYGNITEQMRISKTDPALAADLKAKARVAELGAAQGQQFGQLSGPTRLGQLGNFTEVSLKAKAGDTEAIAKLRAAGLWGDDAA